jgi:hypothetical protein
MSEVDNISITYSDNIDNVEINYLSTVDNITLNIGDGLVSSGGVTAVNSLTGDVVLTASATLSTLFDFGGVYFYTFQHNLNFKYPIISIYDLNDNYVISDYFFIDENYASITSSIDITGYKAVAQR